MKAARGRILLASNSAWTIANFRGGLIRALLAAGYEVVAAAHPDEHVARIEAWGIRYVPVRMDLKGTNPFRDLALFLRFVRLLRRERPAVFLSYTVKPNVYGGVAARMLGIPAINNIAGLGTAFVNDTWLTRVVERLYRVGLARARKVFFQNEDDRRLFLERGLVSPAVAERIPGSGVDTAWFAPEAASPPPENETIAGAAAPRPLRFLLSVRLMRDKGVGEFIAAARTLKAEGAPAEFLFLGFLDVENRTAIPRAEVEAWVREGVVRYLGAVEDVRPVLAQADCVVLPSYREGVPRSLLEAASMAKPVITTDAPGCRDVVDDGATGFLCRPRDAVDLARQMRRMIALSAEERAQMGRAGRAKMLREFDERIVIGRYLKAIGEILKA
jgi:glycosyltransferase involved in cell wall biosynthesis